MNLYFTLNITMSVLHLYVGQTHMDLTNSSTNMSRIMTECVIFRSILSFLPEISQNLLPLLVSAS